MAVRTGQQIKLNDNPELEELITKSFLEYSSRESEKDEIPENIIDKVILIAVIWDDIIGPKLVNQFPKDIKTEYSMNLLSDQLYNLSKSIYGQDHINTAGCQLIEVQNFNVMAYVFFDSYPDITSRGGVKDFMLSLIAPKITYIQSLKLKEVFTKLSLPFKRQEKWSVELYWNKLLAILTEDLRVPFKAYKGDEPFVFVSHSNNDKLQVYPIIDYLDKLNFNIWYDAGISVSQEMMKSIMQNINKCTVFLVFITPNIIDSKFVRREISYAIKKDKPFYLVYLKDTKLPDELDFEISGIQSMKKYTMPDSEFYDTLKEVLSSVLSGEN